MEDSLDKLGPIFNRLGQELAFIADGDPDGVFLYVEIGEGWVTASVFKEEEDLVRDLDFDDSDLYNLLFEAWYAEPTGKRWSVMEYAIRDGRFSVDFKFPDEVTVGSFGTELLDAALRARYGDKPIVYPPPPEGMFELKP